jgi:hypothetical protein
MELRVNGDIRQKGNTSRMVLSMPAVPDLLRCARGDDAAEIDDHDAIAEAQHQAHVVVDEEHAHSPAGE